MVRCQTLQRNLNFTDCLPYSGQSCYVSCKAGYKLVINRTVSCGSDGQWIPSIDTLCKGINLTTNIVQHMVRGHMYLIFSKCFYSILGNNIWSIELNNYYFACRKICVWMCTELGIDLVNKWSFPLLLSIGTNTAKKNPKLHEISRFMSEQIVRKNILCEIDKGVRNIKKRTPHLIKN